MLSKLFSSKLFRTPIWSRPTLPINWTLLLLIFLIPNISYPNMKQKNICKKNQHKNKQHPPLPGMYHKILTFNTSDLWPVMASVTALKKIFFFCFFIYFVIFWLTALILWLECLLSIFFSGIPSPSLPQSMNYVSIFIYLFIYLYFLLHSNRILCLQTTHNLYDYDDHSCYSRLVTALA